MGTFAIIETGGKQYRVEPSQRIRIEKLSASPKTASRGGPAAIGETLVFDKVLLVDRGNAVEIGMPYVAGAKVGASLVKEGRGRKTLVFKYHSKTRYRKKAGHRQHYTEVEIKSIS
ncbi:MAG: 50S ribosomal protein L21 [bacterium]|nr:50S ribosomal protein L21 [bacterium]